MSNPAHNLLDQLMNEVKKNLVDHQIEKMKTKILNLNCNGTYWLLLTGHFGPVFIRPSQWSITAVFYSLAHNCVRYM